MKPARFLGTMALAVTSLAAAERNIEIAPAVGYRNGASLDSNASGSAGADASASPSWGLSVGWWTRPDGWLEVLFDRQTLEFEPTASSQARRFDIVVDYLQFGGGYEPRRERVRPYVTASVGLNRFGSIPGPESETTGLSASIGGGFKAPLGRKVLFRLEARGWAVLTSGSATIVCGPGCSFTLNGSGWWQVGLRAAVAFCPGGTR
jgi:hypothetical protein